MYHSKEYVTLILSKNKLNVIDLKYDIPHQMSTQNVLCQIGR